MARHDITLRRVHTILDELDQLQTSVRERAYDLFRKRGGVRGGQLTDWFTAERQLVWKPAIELRQKGTQFEIRAATPGVEAKDLDVQITPDDVLIKAETHHKHLPEEWSVRVCEFTGGQLFRSIHFPEKIDPNTATAEYRNGMLRVTASMAKSTGARAVEVKVA